MVQPAQTAYLCASIEKTAMDRSHIKIHARGNSPAQRTFSPAKMVHPMRLSNPIRIVVISSLLLFCSICHLPAWGQYNVYSFDHKFEGTFAHFGILMGYNSSRFHVSRSDRFLVSDSIRSVESTTGPGFNLGIISNLHIGNNFDIRFLPSFTFSERSLYYQTFGYGDLTQRIESVNLEFPLLLKFKSNPYKDLRMYVLAGIKYTYDLASNAEARNAEDIVKVGRHDFLVDYGFGLEIYFPYFIFAPEIRISQGIFDVHARDPKLNLSNVLDRLFTRSIVVVFNFEG